MPGRISTQIILAHVGGGIVSAEAQVAVSICKIFILRPLGVKAKISDG